MDFTQEASGEPASRPWEDMACSGEQRLECERLAEVLTAKKRITEAMLLYARSCRYGSGLACSKVGWHFMQDGNSSDAYTTFQRACSLEHGPACFYIGTLAEEPESQTLAYHRACDYGVDLACERVGRDKAQTPQDNPLADEGVCSSQDLNACYQQGRKHLQASRYRQAVADLRPVCDKEVKADSCHYLGTAYLNLENQEAAKLAFFRACRGDVAASCHLLGELESADDPAAAEAYYRKACRMGAAQSCYQLAKGYNDEAIADQTISFLKQGCELGHSASCFSLRAAERETEGLGPAASH
jgi:TPR repeat protein